MEDAHVQSLPPVYHRETSSRRQIDACLARLCIAALRLSHEYREKVAPSTFMEVRSCACTSCSLFDFGSSARKPSIFFPNSIHTACNEPGMFAALVNVYGRDS